MIKSFFFVPAVNPKFISKIPELKADNFILDLEDSVAPDKYSDAVANLENIVPRENFFIRPQVTFVNDELIEKDDLKVFTEIGYENFVLPKIENRRQLETVINCFGNKQKKIILLVENPKLLVKLNEIVESGMADFYGIGLGSHDYTDFMGMKHTPANLNYAENLVLNIAKANDILAIDKASMNLGDEKSFKDECFAGFDGGYDAKFIITPFQLNILNSLQYFTDDEINEAELVYNQIKDLPPEQFSVVKVNGVLYEKPHLKRIRKIIEWKENAGI